MNKSKLLTGIIILLLLVNSAALIYLWRSNNVSKREAMLSPAEFLIRKTGMDDAQKNKYYELVKQHRKATRRLKDDLTLARETYFSFLGKNVSDSSKQSALQEMNSINNELSLITFDHFTNVRSLCNKEQQVKFDDAIEEVLKMMAGPPPGNRRPGGKPPHEGPPPHERPQDGPPFMDDE